jgi:prepilin-type processing-associated H-X9-DG protein
MSTEEEDRRRCNLRLRIDLLILVLVVVFGMGLIFSPLSFQAKDGPRSPCKRNLKQIGVALLIYAEDNKGSFPLYLEQLLPYYLSDASVLQCPHESSAAGPSDYIYLPGLNVNNRPGKVLAYDKLVNHNGDGRNILFIDGHVEWLNENVFQELMRKQRSLE